MADRIRVSFIEFLNALPLGWGFLHGSDRGSFDLLFDVPSECARRLSTGQADVGLIPVIEYLRIPDLSVIPGIAIASRRRVKSVLFVSRWPIEQVQRVAIDTSSRTSVALLKILFARFYGKEQVEYFPSPPNPREMLRDCDAGLLIGNPALQFNLDGLYVYDLAKQWNYFTGLPFVFAFWAVRDGVVPGRWIEAFHRSKREGIAAIDRIAVQYAPRLGLSPHEIKSYLLTNLNYSLDKGNLKGLELFLQMAFETGVVEHCKPLHFLELSAILAEGTDLE